MAYPGAAKRDRRFARRARSRSTTSRASASAHTWQEACEAERDIPPPTGTSTRANIGSAG
jgi:hypothetical protein